jgi:hypothetical protein
VKKRAGKIMTSLGQQFPLNWFQTWLLRLAILFMKGRAAAKFVEMVNVTLSAKDL